MKMRRNSHMDFSRGMNNIPGVECTYIHTYMYIQLQPALVGSGHWEGNREVTWKEAIVWTHFHIWTLTPPPHTPPYKSGLESPVGTKQENSSLGSRMKPWKEPYQIPGMNKEKLDASHYSLWSSILFGGKPVHSVDCRGGWGGGGSQGISAKQNVDLKRGAGRRIRDFPTISNTHDE